VREVRRAVGAVVEAMNGWRLVLGGSGKNFRMVARNGRDEDGLEGR